MTQSRKRILLVLGLLVAVLVVSNIFTYIALTGQIDALSKEKADLQIQVNSLNADKDDLTNIINLTKVSILVNNETVGQEANTYTSWIFSLQYAGYVSVNVHVSSTTSTYVQVVYASNTIIFNQMISIGAAGTAVFPVLPSDEIEVRVGNINLLDGANQTVTITYNY